MKTFYDPDLTFEEEQELLCKTGKMETFKELEIEMLESMCKYDQDRVVLDADDFEIIWEDYHEHFTENVESNIQLEYWLDRYLEKEFKPDTITVWYKHPEIELEPCEVTFRKVKSLKDLTDRWNEFCSDHRLVPECFRGYCRRYIGVWNR